MVVPSVCLLDGKHKATRKSRREDTCVARASSRRISCFTHIKQQAHNLCKVTIH